MDFYNACAVLRLPHKPIIIIYTTRLIWLYFVIEAALSAWHSFLYVFIFVENIKYKLYISICITIYKYFYVRCAREEEAWKRFPLIPSIRSSEQKRMCVRNAGFINADSHSLYDYTYSTKCTVMRWYAERIFANA